MNALLRLWQREPAVIVALIDAVLVAAVTFGVPITPAEKAAVDATLTALAGVVIRSQVSPTATVPHV